MAFTTLAPQASKSRLATGVNVAWRGASNRKYHALYVSFDMETINRSGWRYVDRLSVQYCDETARLRITAARPTDHAFALTRHSRNGRPAEECPAHIVVPLPGIHGEKRVARPAEWQIEEGATIIQLPEWAQHPRHRPKPAAVPHGPGMPARSRAA